MGRSVWVLCQDYGTEGLQEPFIAFATEKAAQVAKGMLDKFDVGYRVRIVEAPLYEVMAAGEGRVAVSQKGP